MKRFIKNIIKNTPALFNLSMYVLYSRQFKRYLKLNQIPNEPCEIENEYKKKWGRFGVKVEPYSCRLFYSYFKMANGHGSEMNQDGANIVPENIGRCYIEPVFNPMSMHSVYEDKNMFPVICGKEALPETFICRMGGGPILDGDYNPIQYPIEYYLKGNRLVLKPSVDSCSGDRIMLFEKKDEYWIAKNGGGDIMLTADFLLKYGNDFVVQEAVKQHPDIARFNPSSVNTLRIAVYRSVVDNEPHVLASVIRIGKHGMFVDNAHAGGLFVGIDIESGKLQKVLFDQYGKQYSSLNGVDYGVNDFVIPHWGKAKKLVCNIAKKLVHHRLIAFDVTIDSMGEAKLIEYNISGFGYWLYMFTGQSVFGKYTDEVIDYCVNRKNEK